MRQRVNAEGIAELAEGTELGKYKVVRLIGAGAMGAVYEATDGDSGKRVALKVLDARLASRPEARARFVLEAKITKRVHHPHIVDVTDVGEAGGRVYIVMELLTGEDLAQRLERAGAIPAQETADIMVPICGAIAAAHQAGVTHRDLKPHNIFLAERNGRVHPKVLDFGISVSEDPALASPRRESIRRPDPTLVGSPCYLAPEQVVTSRSAGPATDQYALGVITYECLTGHRPFDGDNLNAVLLAISAGHTPPPSTWKAELPLELEAIVLKTMSRDPADRFASVNDLGRALLPFASGRTRLFWEQTFADRRGGKAITAPAGETTVVSPPPAQTLAAVTPDEPMTEEPTARQSDPEQPGQTSSGGRRWSSADLRTRLGAAPSGTPSPPTPSPLRLSPAIAAEAATPSPYVKTLPPEAPELVEVSEPSMIPPVAIEQPEATIPNVAYEEESLPPPSLAARLAPVWASKGIRLGGGAAIALGAIALVVMVGRSGASSKPAALMPAAQVAAPALEVAPPPAPAAEPESPPPQPAVAVEPEPPKAPPVAEPEPAKPPPVVEPEPVKPVAVVEPEPAKPAPAAEPEARSEAPERPAPAPEVVVKRKPAPAVKALRPAARKVSEDNVRAPSPPGARTKRRVPLLD